MFDESSLGMLFFKILEHNTTWELGSDLDWATQLTTMYQAINQRFSLEMKQLLPKVKNTFFPLIYWSHVLFYNGRCF